MNCGLTEVSANIAAKSTDQQCHFDAPAGYKNSEVGLIPKDWQVCALSDVTEFLDGNRRPIKSADRARISGDFPYYGASGIVDYVDDYIFDDDLILLGEDGENILSRNLPLAFRVSGKIWVNNHAHVIKPKKEFDIGYLTAFLESLDYSLLNSGTAQPKLNKQSCLKIKVAKPSKEEQTVIAKALSDVDGLISSMEALVTKKQAIKTAAMQQLLTGRTRLPQFALREDGTPKGYKTSELGQLPEDWGIVELRDVSQFINGRAFSIHEWRASGTPVIRLQNLTGRGEDYYYSNLQLPEKQYCHRGDLLFMWSATFGPIIWKGDKAIFHYHIWKIECKSGYIETFFYYLLSDMTEKLKSGSSSGGTMLHVTKGAMESTLAAFPVSAEQRAIAEVLSSMDEEIKSLEERLSKTRDIKQGMMQELLTGKTRLI
ncbi:type I restriction enzyme, S subunit [Marinobacter sp. LV10R510-11A]|uniref:restriction endonuclease subunit S n=1 Tax=Marinobacter sp. LV10R510-11A TaxID=1415568 RepID=UPI000BC07B24|nr:restriction endonuclease subunit S [Marinobacter sp. LV10R510-11A]SOB75611.1 type I restriction enzyme, S subunit [Marinobacter sp. LV10R510-11A]